MIPNHRPLTPKLRRSQAAGALRLWLLVALVLLVPGTVRGVEWYVAYQEGLELAASGQCNEAIAPLREAAAAKPKAQKRARTYGRNFITDYDPHFHLARCFAELGDRASASASLERSRSYGVTSERLLEQLEERLRALPARTSGPPRPETQAPAKARLTLRSDPPGAVVRIDGTLYGQTPVDGLELAAGEHRLVVDKPGFTPHERTLQLAAGVLRELDLTLVPAIPSPPPDDTTAAAETATGQAEPASRSAGETGRSAEKAPAERTGRGSPPKRDAETEAPQTTAPAPARDAGATRRSGARPQNPATEPERLDIEATDAGTSAGPDANRAANEPSDRSAGDATSAEPDATREGPIPAAGTSGGSRPLLWIALPVALGIAIGVLFLLRRRQPASAEPPLPLPTAARPPEPEPDGVEGEEPTVLSSSTSASAATPSIGQQQTVRSQAADSTPTSLEARDPAPAEGKLRDARRRATLRGSLAEADTVSEAAARLAGYTLEAELGRGGMATTYRGCRLSDGAPVALKVPHDTGDASFFERFIREGKLGETLHHPNIVRILEAGEDDGIAFIAMELIPGKTLKQAIRETGPFPLDRALQVTRDIAEALDYAHAKRVVHRDLKPDNIMLLPDGTTKVMDFGIARVEGQHGLTASQLFIGTPAYAAPEQLEPKRVDHRTDLYALGIILYEMLEGTTPFRADSPLRLLEMHMREPLPAPDSLERPVPGEVWRVITTLCAKDPADRFENAQALLNALHPLIHQPTAGDAPARRTTSFPQ